MCLENINYEGNLMKKIIYLIAILNVLLILMNTLFAASASDLDKTRIAVLNFESEKGFDIQDAKTLTQKFTFALSKTNKFDIMSRAQMDKIKEEKNIQISEDFNAASAVKLGEALGVAQVIIGQVSKIGSTFTITVQLVEVETLKIEKMASQDFTGAIDQALPVIQVLAAEIADSTPIPETSPTPDKENIITPTPKSDPYKNYTAYNLWYEKPELIYFMNYKNGTMIPAGSEVTEFRVELKGRSNYIHFRIADNFTQFTIMQDKWHALMPIDEFKNRLFKNKNFAEITYGFTQKEIDNIKTGKIEVGMRKDAVIAAYGYPAFHKTPSINANIWYYYRKTSRDAVSVTFDSLGYVQNIRE